jgi:hypothetical protein
MQCGWAWFRYKPTKLFFKIAKSGSADIYLGWNLEHYFVYQPIRKMHSHQNRRRDFFPLTLGFEISSRGGCRSPMLSFSFLSHPDYFSLQIDLEQVFSGGKLGFSQIVLTWAEPCRRKFKNHHPLAVMAGLSR